MDVVWLLKIEHAHRAFRGKHPVGAPLRVDFIWFLPGDVTVVGEYDGMAKYGNTWTEVNTHVTKQCKRAASMEDEAEREYESDADTDFDVFDVNSILGGDDDTAE